MIEIDTPGKALFYPIMVPVFVLSYAFFFMGGGHAPFILYIPYLLIAGPAALFAYYLHGDFVWVMIGSLYLLYSLYAFILVFWGKNKTRRDWTTGGIFLLHCVCAVWFYLAGM